MRQDRCRPLPRHQAAIARAIAAVFHHHPDLSFVARDIDRRPAADFDFELPQRWICTATRVYERRHKQNFHFRLSRQAGQHQFSAGNNGLLAFAARCTSSFPFAFEPMTMARAKHLKGTLSDAIDNKWPKYLSYLPAQEVANKTHISRAFGDGGYLDNKPFSYVTQVLSTRHAVVPVERKLIYVEPAPEKIDPDHLPDADAPVPNALENSTAALATIPRYETIREDLQEVLKRNRSIERIDRIIREGEYDLRLALHPIQEDEGVAADDHVENLFLRIIRENGGNVRPWPTFTRAKMVRYYGTAILAYRRMRVSTTTDALGQRLAELWEIDPASDHLYALTALVRVWREHRYHERDAEQETKNETESRTISAFLDEFDVAYRIRKMGFLLRQIDHVRRIVQGRPKDILKPGAAEFELLPAPDKLVVSRLLCAGLPLMDENLARGSLECARGVARAEGGIKRCAGKVAHHRAESRRRVREEKSGERHFARRAEQRASLPRT